MKVDLQPNELVLKAGNTRFLNGSEICGKLILTNQRIYFKSLKGDHKKDFEMLPKDILEVIYFKQGLFSSGGLNIVMKDGEQLKFVLKERNQWGRMINKMY